MRLDVVEHGLYALEAESTVRDANGVGVDTVRNICHLATTATIALRQGTHFGLRYRMQGAAPDEIVTLTTVVRFPHEARPPAGSAPIGSHAMTFEHRAGDLGYAGYGFDEPWELMAGSWTVQIFNGTRQLLEFRFTVVEGADEPRPSTRGTADCFQMSSL
ncbi:MAG: hypothetical protein BGN99_15375 [Alphaproteobacteria bacterium 65-37]|nr:DUF3859 domain-containing protein [Alphaproteobacteria bacterium]OJU38625.1 MAG: hypothetical protein BGN99_15375 [Alphaproteobacteria bacterium 65-37]